MDSWGIGFGKRKMENGKRENNASWLSTKLEAANCQQFRNSNCVAIRNSLHSNSNSKFGPKPVTRR